MSRASFFKVREAFHTMLELSKHERLSFLATMASQDPEVHAEVLSLMEQEPDDLLDGFLRVPALGTGFSVCAAVFPQEPPSVPNQLGSFRIKRILGGGLYSLVLHAEENRPDCPPRSVALKILRPGCCSESMRRRFIAEGDSLLAITHEDVVRVFSRGVFEDFGPWQGTPFLCLEYVDGTSIDEFCRRETLNRQERLDLFARVCDAIQHAHHKGIIHRDLKVTNILVSRSNRKYSPKVIDFGVALNSKDEPSATLTRHGELLGTISNMSPEQLSGNSNGVDTRTDVYSLGVVLYELVTNQPLWDLEGLSFLEATRVIAGLDRPPACGIDGDLRTIITKSLERERDQRYPTVSELAADVRRFRDGFPIMARPPTIQGILARWAWRHRAFTILSGVTSIILLFAAIHFVRSKAKASRNNREMRDTLSAALDISLSIAEFPEKSKTHVANLEDLHSISNDLTARDPENRDFWDCHATIQGALSDAYVKEDNHSQGRALAEDSLRLRQRLVESDPGSVDLRKKLSLAYVRLGDAKRREDDSQGSLEAYLEALQIDDFLAAEGPNERELQDNLGWSHDRIGHYYLERRMDDLAAACIADQLRIARWLVQRFKGDYRGYFLLSEGLKKSHVISARNKDPLQFRLNLLDEALSAARKAVELEPRNGLLQDRLGSILIRIGNQLDDMDPLMALSHLDQGISITRDLYRADPSRTDLLSRIYFAGTGRARALLILGRTEDAAVQINQSVQGISAIVSIRGTHVMRRRLANALLIMVDVLERQLRIEEASEALVQAHGINLDLARESDDPLTDQLRCGQLLINRPAHPEDRDRGLKMLLNGSDRFPQEPSFLEAAIRELIRVEEIGEARLKLKEWLEKYGGSVGAQTRTRVISIFDEIEEASDNDRSSESGLESGSR